jgi:hypothetical protein
LLAVVVSAASEVVNSVGKQFAQPIRLRGKDGLPKVHLVGKVLGERSLGVESAFEGWFERYQQVERGDFEHEAIREDYAIFLSSFRGELGAIYADPPYTRDHYSRYYHVLETICLRDEPAVSRSNLGNGNLPSRGMYRAGRHQSPFCIKSQAPGAFAKLFLEARRQDVPLVVSYSPFDKEGGAHPRLLSVDTIVELARRVYSKVDVTSLGHFSHSKFNASRLSLSASSEAEVLISCKP